MKNVLVVEDSPVLSEAIRIILENEGIRVFVNNDGLKVVEMIKKEGICLVILDLMMPGVSGERLFELITKDAQAKKARIMILTAKADALKHDSALKRCDKFMTKPFDNKELVSEVKKLLR